MGIDWEYLRGVTGDSGDWGEAELEELYQTLVGITKLRSRDKTVEKLEMLFTLTQAVMMAKYSQVVVLEEEVGHLAESAGRGDAKREQELLAEINRLQAVVDNGRGTTNDENIAYDWSSGWRLKKKEMEESIQQKNLEIQQFMDDLQVSENERTILRSSVMELEDRLAEATKEINNSLIVAREELEGFHSHIEEMTLEKAQLQQKFEELSTAVDARVDKLKEVVSQREEELQRMRSMLYQRSNLPPGSVQQTQNDLSQILQLEQEVRERDAEVARLGEQLTEASREIESSALLITKLKNMRVSAVEGDAAIISQLRGELHEARQHMQQMRTQLLAAEEDAQLHAQDLSTVIGELQSYMAGEYSLADALRELKEVRSQVRIRDSQISQLTVLVNTLQININELIEENVNKTDWQNSKKIIDQLTNQVNKLLDEKVTLRTKIYDLTRELSNAKGSLQLTTLELPKGFGSGETSRLQTQCLEEQLNNLSAAVNQLLLEQKVEHQENHLQFQLEALKEKHLRLEGEKASLERIIHSDFMKRKKTEDREQSTESSSTQPSSKKASEKSLHSSKSPMEALDELIATLGQLPPSTEEVIAKLKNQECSKREDEISQREKTNAIYTNQFESLRSQVTDLNSILSGEQDKWISEKRELEKSVCALEDEVKALKAQTGELQSTIDAISSGRPDVDAKLARRLAELRYDLEISHRLTKNQRNEISSLHGQLKDKLEEVQQSLLQEKQLKHEKEHEQQILKHRIYKLEGELSQSVPRTTADQTSAQSAAITAKYRSLLQAQSLTMQEKNQEVQLMAEKQQLLEEREQLSQLLESAREKVHSLQASLNLVGKNTTHIQVEILSKQLAAIELRELREKQKAEHSSIMYHNIKKECVELQHRVQQLQDTLDATSKMNLALQTTETELRQQLQGAIKQEEYTRVTKQVQHITDEKAQLLSDVKRLQSHVDVLSTQLKQKELIKNENQVEVDQLRQEVQDLAATSDERTNMGQLHQEIIFLKVKNLESIAALDETKAMNEKQTIEILRLSQQLRDRERLLETAVDTNRARSTKLYIIIRDLRQQYAGAVPLSQQERYVDLLETLKQERNALQVALQSAQHDKMESKITLRQLKIKQEALDELKMALSSPKSTTLVASWCTNLEEAKLKNVELEEKVQTLEENQALSQARLEGKERRLAEVQTQLLSLEKLWMDEQLLWDEREVELTRALEKHETRHKAAALDLKTLGFHELPDTTLPISKQLEEALDSLRNKVTFLEKAEMELEKFRNEVETIRKDLREKEIAVIARDKIINELRIIGSNLKVPVVRSEAAQDVTDQVKSKSLMPEEESIKIVIEGLKERLHMSQHTVNHYQDLLAKAHEEKQDLAARNRDEFLRVTRECDEAVLRARELQSQLDSIPTRDRGSSALSEAQAAQIQSLEETIKVIEVQLDDAKSQLIVLERKAVQLERDLTIARREHAEEREHLEVSAQLRVQQHQRETDRLSGELNKIRCERDNLREEVAILQESASRKPSAILRTLVEKLRDQLIEKEKQVSKLTMAVQDMKERISQNQMKDEGIDLVSVEKEVSQATNKLTESFNIELEKISAAKDDLEHKLHNQILSLTAEKDKISAEVDTLNEEIKILKGESLRTEKQLLQQKRFNNALKQKLEDLEGKSPLAITRAIESLQEKLKKMDAAAEIEENEIRKAKSQEQIVRWEERKKLQGVIDKLKARVKELETTHDVHLKKLETSQDLLSKVETEKLSLQFKLNNLSKVSTEKMCGVCLKTLNTLDSRRGSLVQEGSSPAHSSQTVRASRTVKQNRVNPSPERVPVKADIGDVQRDKAKSPLVSRRSQSEQDDSEMRFRIQLKKALEEKHSLEFRLKGALEEIYVLRNQLQQKEEEEEKLIAERKGPAARRVGGAAVVLEYESRVRTLEDELRQKTRLLAHVKEVVREAANREESLLEEKGILLQKVTLLESISEDTPAARLVHELRQAKLTITRLQRLLDNIQGNS
ncbi:Centrosomal protein of 290 kDa-like 1 [Homarus americanus]|uniref:Centrosomal protein of 290 kDa-like 1 n=1 Tax=Homarus americanus TaxID=6706 RepID=A0A8J5N6N4_HOMAM|nr:Centrosomal protein of 290 kDa-like 1 [Homarus americanus]